MIGSGQQQLRRFRSAPFSLARVIETAGPRLRVRLVGTDDRNDCWFLVDSDEIRPYPSNETLQPPFGYVHNHLVWNKTLRKTVEEGKAAPTECFARVRFFELCASFVMIGKVILIMKTKRIVLHEFVFLLVFNVDCQKFDLRDCSFSFRYLPLNFPVLSYSDACIRSGTQDHRLHVLISYYVISTIIV